MATTLRGKKTELSLLLVLTVMFLSPQLLLGAVAPDVTRLLTINKQTFSARVASDAAGNIYVADILYNKVRVYNYKGELKTTISLKYTPTAIAVSPGNLLYVGENAQNGHYYIDIFNSAGASVRTLDAVRPAAMAFLSTGEMYLVDGYKVKKFDAAMNVVMEFGGYSIFRDPSAIAISEQKGEFYVLDRGGTATEGAYANTPVWRVQAFDLAGAPLRSFSSYGYGAEGKIGSASGIAVDKDGRIYISDNLQPIIAVFDANGVFLKTIYDAANPLYNMANITYNNDRLYLASLAGNFVTAYAVGAYTVLDAAPNPIDFTWQKGMADPSKTLTISNSGTAPLTWNATVDAASASWLSISQSTGTVAANSGQDVTVAVSTAGFGAVPPSAGTITITTPGGEKLVAVNVTVAPAATLTVSPATINISRKSSETTAPIPITITIGNDVSGGTLKWSASVSPDAGWLSVNPVEGPSTLPAAAVRIADAVAAGSYNGSITVTLGGADGSPVTVPVTLEVIAASNITVTTNNADAKFTISGPAGFAVSDSGLNFTQADVAPGSYTVTYENIAGFKTPASETKTIDVGQSAAFVGDYADLRKNLNIVASHGSHKSESNEVEIFSMDPASGAVSRAFSFTPSMPYAYGVSTAVGDVDGDKAADIIVGGAPSVVKGFTRGGAAIPGLEFSAYSRARGVNLAAADFDADGHDDIITGDATDSSVVRVFSYSASAVADTGVYIEPFKDLGQGVNVAAADVDGDGAPELIALQADSDVVPEVKIYKVNTAAGSGHWTADMTGRFKACSTPAATGLAAADVDADGVSDIIVLCRGRRGTEVREFSGSGNLIGSFRPTMAVGSLAAGDINFDGSAEIILGGAASDRDNKFWILDPKGTLIKTMQLQTRSYGVRVSVGNLGY
ncbi:MAG: FG-GAP-like repeat-containing protein [Nitrospiraceae bacterium]|nr:FG-GAP-like repeat-containing protein [Nitrospiraceae bacterium]